MTLSNRIDDIARRDHHLQRSLIVFAIGGSIALIVVLVALMMSR